MKDIPSGKQDQFPRLQQNRFSKNIKTDETKNLIKNGRDEKGCKMDVDNVDQVEKGSGRRRPRKQHWATLTTFFRTYCIIKNVAK